MSRSDHRALESHLRVLLMHLLKWRYQPAGRQTGHSWADSIREARTQVANGLETHPGMHQHVPAILVRAWRKARREASHQAGLSLPSSLRPARGRSSGCSIGISGRRRRPLPPADCHECAPAAYCRGCCSVHTACGSRTSTVDGGKEHARSSGKEVRNVGGIRERGG